MALYNNEQMEFLFLHEIKFRQLRTLTYLEGHRISFIVSGMGILIIVYIDKLYIAFNTDTHIHMQI